MEWRLQYGICDYCNCSCLELGTTLHHVQLQLLNVLCWIVTMTMAHVGAEKTRGTVKM